MNIIQNIYTIYDMKAKSYSQPFYSTNDETAMRAVDAAVQEEGHDFNRNTQDYRLYRIGGFDGSTGVVSASDRPVLICDLMSIKKWGPAED